MSIFYKIFLAFSLLFCVQFVVAQVTPSPADTVRTIYIIKARSQRQITVDTTIFQTLAGEASVRQGSTILHGDSIILNQLTGIAEVFGNVHINDGDTMHTYAQYLKYIGNDRIAYLKKNVKLTDGKATLLTEDLEYNLATGIANYKKGGKVINDKTVLTSEAATYYSETKDVIFKQNVHLVDPKYNMTADSLRYNTEFKTAYFISPTHIISKDGVIDTKSGSYNLETGNAIFDSRSSIRDSSMTITGDKIAFEGNTGTVQVEGRGKFVDSVNNVIVLGDELLINRNNKTFLATRKPVMIFFKDGDSTYISADTLFSGLRKYDSVEKKVVSTTDTLKKSLSLSLVNKKDSAADKTPQPGNVLNIDSALSMITKNEIPVKDSVRKDTLLSKPRELPARDTLKYDTVAAVITRDTLMVDSAKKIQPGNAVAEPANMKDTIKQTTAVDMSKMPKDSIRYFLGFHHVKIFNDSMQAVSDSMYYSTEDSTFKLFGNPVFWNDSTQVKGDTMHLYTENQKPKRLYVFFNSIVVNKTREGFYNQMGGRTINGYFKDGTVDYIRVKGSPAESIFYPQDEDSAYVGMNRSKGDVIDIFFVQKELNKIKFINDVDGTLYPLRQVPQDQKYLKNFIWEDKRRPKNKLELFE